jgi:hypothetical protein
MEEKNSSSSIQMTPNRFFHFLYDIDFEIKALSSNTKYIIIATTNWESIDKKIFV